MAKGLGRGIESLFEDTDAAFERVYEHRSAFDYTEEERKNAEDMELIKIHPNPNQPRKNFDEQALKELSDSIKKHGVIMPIVVNDEGDGSYMIIAGEEIPCLQACRRNLDTRCNKKIYRKGNQRNFAYRKLAEGGFKPHRGGNGNEAVDGRL